jgi:ribosome-binding protein aMBF1 (putative translation factor)
VDRSQISRMGVEISPEQCRAARAWLGWSQTELAQRARIGLSSVKDFERGSRRTLPAIKSQMQKVFEEAGVVFMDHGIAVPPKEV